MYTLLLISNKSVLLLHNDKICKFHIYSELVKEFQVVGLPFFLSRSASIKLHY